MKQIIRIGVLVAPWLMAVALPIWLLPGFVDSNTGSIDSVHLLGFELVMIPLAPLMLLEKWIFDERKAEVIFALEDGKEVGFALFFHNFSTFLGRAGIYLEDLYVRTEYRGKGYGKSLLKELARIAVERGCGRLEWWCLDWNQPSIDFYLSLGAEPMKDWTVYRIAGETLQKLAKR